MDLPRIWQQRLPHIYPLACDLGVCETLCKDSST